MTPKSRARVGTPVVAHAGPWPRQARGVLATAMRGREAPRRPPQKTALKTRPRKAAAYQLLTLPWPTDRNRIPPVLALYPRAANYRQEGGGWRVRHRRPAINPRLALSRCVVHEDAKPSRGKDAEQEQKDTAASGHQTLFFVSVSMYREFAVSCPSQTASPGPPPATDAICDAQFSKWPLSPLADLSKLRSVISNQRGGSDDSRLEHTPLAVQYSIFLELDSVREVDPHIDRPPSP